jgi:Glycosyltransferases involved in cell wall biogenesis
MKELGVVIPVYNEEDSIGTVISDWHLALSKLDISFDIHVYNDGSRDTTSSVCKRCAAAFSNIRIHDKVNSGHGPTILQGYTENACNYEWLFQVDSDNEMNAKFFHMLWSERKEYDFLLGRRLDRNQEFSRAIVSFISRLIVHGLYGKGVWDVNSPYRLMRSEVFVDVFHSIPRDTFAPNIIISGMASRLGLRCYEVAVPHEERSTGEVSIKRIKLLLSALKAFKQTIVYSFLNAR